MGLESDFEQWSSRRKAEADGGRECSEGCRRTVFPQESGRAIQMQHTTVSRPSSLVHKTCWDLHFTLERENPLQFGASGGSFKGSAARG